jgi:hypothetical protein
MLELGKLFPPPPTHPSHNLIVGARTRAAEEDLAFRIRAKRIEEKLPFFVKSRMDGGTGLPISKVLRSYFFEFAARIVQHGYHSLPTAFNIVESFLTFSHEYYLFDLHDEREHLLRFGDYLDWYTAGNFPELPSASAALFPEATIYEYNMTTPQQDFTIQTDDSSLLVLGIAFVRHDDELSIMAVLGEHPAFPPDDLVDDQSGGRPVKGKERLQPNPELKMADRYLEEAPGFCRVVALTRFDLSRQRYAVRHLAIDMGNSFRVFTDDPDIYPAEITREEKLKYLEASEEGLNRYRSVFATLAVMIYLPAFFLAEPRNVETLRFSTELGAKRTSARTRKAIRLLGKSEVPLEREVRCRVATSQAPARQVLQLEPPGFDFERSGYWKNLPPTQVGKDKEGNPIVGRTWVERSESWSSSSLENFVVHRQPPQNEGPDPGEIYVIRSDSHYVDIYKIGLTRRSVPLRAGEVSSATGVPTPFGVLASWSTGRAQEVESEVHRRLDNLRVNTRREFFRAPLTNIIQIINEVVAELQ